MDEGREGGGKKADGGHGSAALGPMAKGIRSAQPWMDAVWKLVGGAVVGVLGGWFMDRHLGTGPWGLVGLSTLGIGVGFYGFIRAALKLGKR